MASHCVELSLPVVDRSAEGHFPGNPIIPGAVLLRTIVGIVAADDRMICCEIRSARFLHPVRPGDRLTIGWEEKTAGEIGFTCSTGSPERRVLVGTLRMRTR
jgi:3-hydroxymyristoyl/3-hydroxydecanoyl-(acyl carrier protein) dehydratase